jgi:uncharacterized membrane protein YfhO
VTDFTIRSDDNSILQTLFSNNFDPEKQVILEEDPHIVPTRLPANNSVAIVRYEENKAGLRTATTVPAILVLLDNYYPGWQAFIDGKETAVYRANYTFRAISLPPGEHAIEFIYKPMSVSLGMLISLLSLCLLVYLYIRKLFGLRKLQKTERIKSKKAT